MKIQPTTAKSTHRNKKAGSKAASGAFQSLFSSQMTSETKVQSPDEKSSPHQESAPQPKQKPVVEEALHLLEKTMLMLDEGEAIPEQAILAIEDLRQALRSTNNHLNMNDHDLNAAETLLAVEAKRLETLNKI